MSLLKRAHGVLLIEANSLLSIGTLPRAVWILFAGTFLNRFGTFVMPFLVLYLARRGFSEAQAGMALGAYGAGHVTASLLGGYLADRLGRRHTVMLSMFLSAVAMLALAQAESLSAIMVLTFAAGLCTELYRPAANAWVIDLCPPEAQVTASAFYRLFVNLGFAAGPITAGFLAQRSYYLLFVGDAITSVLFGLITLFALPADSYHPAPPRQARSWIVTALADHRFARFLLASLAVSIVMLQMDSTLPLHVKKVGLSTATYGALASINGLMIVLLEVALTVATQRRQPKTVMALGFLLTGAGFALTGIAMSQVALGLTIVLWTFGEMISSPVAGAYVAQLAPRHLRGRYMGLWGATWSLAMVLGPTLGTLLFAQSETALWATCGVVGAVAAVLVLL